MRGLAGARALAVLIALSALFGLAVQFTATFGATGSAAATIWIMLRYFTILTNLLVAAVFSGIAVRPSRTGAATVLGGITLTILLVAVVYHLLLRGTLVQTGPEKLADLFLHSVTPALVLLFWLVVVRRGGLRRRDPPLWAILPILYLGYALLRGAADGIYPYPFLNVFSLGPWPVARNATLIAIGFMAAGYALVWLDGRVVPRGDRRLDQDPTHKP